MSGLKSGSVIVGGILTCRYLMNRYILHVELSEIKCGSQDVYVPRLLRGLIPPPLTHTWHRT